MADSGAKVFSGCLQLISLSLDGTTKSHTRARSHAIAACVPLVDGDSDRRRLRRPLGSPRPLHGAGGRNYPGRPDSRSGRLTGVGRRYIGALECRPNVPASDLHWASSDTITATVDSLAGIVAARRVGQALITVHAPTSTSVLGGEVVRVTAP
jgi:hypothetical protein